MATNTIPGYISEESDVDIPNDEEALTSKRRAKRSRNWDLVDIFKTKQEALHMINKEDIWSYAYVNKTNDGKKIYYRCNKAKKRTEQCPAGLYLFIDNKSEDVHLFKTEEQHEHQGLEKSNRLSEQMKEEIKKLFEFNLKPKKIWDKLTEKGLHPKNKAQVTNYLYQLKQLKYYMNEMWFNTHQNWYEGVKEKTPSTNNCLESFNLVIKKEDTLRERLPLPRFFSLCLESVYKWSNHYVNGLKQYINSPTINLKDWTSGYQWAKSNKIVTSQGLVNSIVYYCPPNDEVKVTNEEIINTKEKNWRSFEQFKKRAFSVWIVELPKEATQWQEGRCTCPSFFKKYICKHIIGLAIRLKYVKPPPNAKDCPINHKRRRGRPNKSSKALFID
jgi:hypothetical protein